MPEFPEIVKGLVAAMTIVGLAVALCCYSRARHCDLPPA